MVKVRLNKFRILLRTKEHTLLRSLRKSMLRGIFTKIVF